MEEAEEEEEEERRSCGDEVRHSSEGSGPGHGKGFGRGLRESGGSGKKCGYHAHTKEKREDEDLWPWLDGIGFDSIVEIFECIPHATKDTHTAHTRARTWTTCSHTPTLLEVTAMTVHLGTFSDGMAEVLSSSAARCDMTY